MLRQYINVYKKELTFCAKRRARRCLTYSITKSFFVCFFFLLTVVVYLRCNAVVVFYARSSECMRELIVKKSV